MSNPQSTSSSHEILTDDYVAGLLAKEANDCSLRYSAMGLDAFKPDKRPANQPKPNTRFLNNIIRDTTSHNRALLAKENAESKARLRDLEHAESQKRDEEQRRERRSKPGPGDTRKRMLGDIAAILGGPPKKRKADSIKDDRCEETASDYRERRSDTRTRERDSGRESRSNRYDRKPTGRSDSPEPQHREDRRQVRDRDRDRDRRRDSRERGERCDKERPRRGKGETRSSRHHRERRDPCANKTERSPRAADESSDSDPLDDIIGPAPPTETTIRRRGRGANAASSGIDSHFAANYDPTVDVSPEPDGPGLGGDWDNAVEAFRDRQKWKQQGAERLRSAGFTEDQVRKWEKGDKKDEADVKWNKAGGLREWDRGKVALDEDDDILVEPEFGRLKGT
ncbi:hypothetical protein F5Y16DRAFT_369832 [Xylariaceae sp. FL0255]|nr:hypothetical protein F5Y16DRAFT_369832 [Xylariaceae sp. FL0255]